MSVTSTLPLPPHYQSDFVMDRSRWIDYAGLQAAAIRWRREHDLRAVSTDRVKIGFLGVDIQKTFCDPVGELFVAGRSGTGAVDDCVRTTEWLYRYLGVITGQHFTLDTHRAQAIFHPPFLVDDKGNHPAPFTIISSQDVRDGIWRTSPFMASALKASLAAAQAHLLHYTEELDRRGRYQLTIWPFHGMLGGMGHTLVPGVEEAAFFHAIARGAQTGYEVKGTNPWTENYSMLSPEVLTGPNGQPIAQRNSAFVQQLLDYDMLVIAGQAKSHCVAWTIDDLLGDIQKQDPALASKVYLLEDCTSPVVVGPLDYTDDANAAFDRFRNAGVHVVRTTDPLETWPGVPSLS